MLHPPVRGVLHDALAAGNGFTDLAPAHRLDVLRVDLRDAAAILLLIRHGGLRASASVISCLYPGLRFVPRNLTTLFQKTVRF
jgi:hypothetical protein